MKQTILFLVGIVFFNNTYSQKVDLILNSIQSISQVEYQVQTKTFFKNRLDTFLTDGKHNLLFTSDDELTGAYFHTDYSDKMNKYNGTEYIIVDKKTQGATVVDLNKMPEWKNRNVRCSNSFISIFWELVKAQNDANFEIEEKENIIKINGKDIAHYGRFVDKTGVNTSIEIWFDKQTFLPIKQKIVSIGNDENVTREIVFSNINVINSHELMIFSKESIDKSIDIVNHQYIGQLKIGEQIPNWCIYDVPRNDENKTLLKDLYQDDLLLIEFWFIHCKYCIKSIPTFNYLYNKYKNQGLKVIYANAINSDKDSDIENFKNKHGAEFNMYRFGNIFEKGSLPTVMLVDRKGIIRYKTDGYSEDLKSEIEQLMTELNK